MMQAINLVKEYAGTAAVNGISIEVERGSCFGLLGPNGAGKTTTVEMLEGIKKPTSGEVRYLGKPLDKDFSEIAGIQLQSTELQDFLTVEENLRFFRRLYKNGLSIERICELCSLQEFRKQDAGKLSGGQRQRLLLGIALVNDPQVMFLDEPTTGLDPQARRNFWSLIEGIKAEGKTIVLTTHYMEEAYQLCDQIAIVDHGQIIAEGSPDALLSRHYADVVIELPLADYPEGLAEPPGKLIRGQGRIELMTHDADAMIRWLVAQDVKLANMTLRARTLEDLFLELTGKALRT